METAEHEKFQASVKLVHTGGCEKSELHVEFGEQDADGCGAEDDTEADVELVAYDVWMVFAADSVPAKPENFV